jgi:hypothetical protein
VPQDVRHRLRHPRRLSGRGLPLREGRGGDPSLRVVAGHGTLLLRPLRIERARSPVRGQRLRAVRQPRGRPGRAPDRAHLRASKAPWYEITDDLPRFPAYPPGIPEPELPARAPRAALPGRIGGSCLCGAVAFDFEPPNEAWHNCHCSRCRRARGGAHASNLFLSAARFHWTRGEDHVASFKLVEAERFTQSFCRTCGSKAPRVNREGGYVAIPAGSLDDDPGSRPERHIYVASKAAWFAIADDLPQFAEFIT